MFREFPRRVPAIVAGAFVLGLGAAELSGQQRPTFVGGVNLRTVDFRVLGSDGLPVIDLKPEEVQLKLDGKTRKVVNVKLVDVAPLGPASATGGAPAKPTLPPPYYSNTGAESGRLVIIAIEDESFRVGKERPMRAAVNQFLDLLDSRDQVGLVTMPHGGWKVHPTTDRERVRQAMSVIIGHAATNESGDEAACRSRTTLEVLATVLGQLGTGGVPPTVLFFSSKMSGPTGIKTPMSSAGAAGGLGVANLEGCALQPLTWSRVGIAAGEARAIFYIIQPDDEPLSPQSTEGLENLAGVTGGTRLAIPAAGDNTLNRVLRETTSHYLVGFEPEDVDNNGMSHSVDLKVTRPGTKVLSRKEVMLPKVGFGATITTQETSAMVRETKVYRDLPLRALAYVARNPVTPPDGNVRILVAAEAEDPSNKLTALEAALFDGEGKMIQRYVASADALVGTPVVGALIAKPGNYRVRVSATDASGRGGTVDQEIKAELAAAGPLKLSSLVLGLSRNGAFLPKLQFGAEPVAVTFLEIYGGQQGQRVGAWLELAQTPDGPPFLIVPLVVEGTSEPDKYKAMGAVAVGSLPPGDLIVRAMVQSEGGPAGTVIRTIRKVG